MSEGIIIALITSVVGFAGVIVSNLTGNKKVTNDIRLDLAKYQATTNEKIVELTREVREHNNFAKRMPVVEEKISNVEEKVNHFHNI